MRTWNRNGIIYVWFDGYGWRSSGLSDRDAAIAWATKNLPSKTPERITLREFSENFFIPGKCSWLEVQEDRGKHMVASTIQRYRRHLEKHIWPALGNYLLDDITLIQVRNWISKLNRSKDTKNKILGTLRVVFDEAELYGYLERSPIDKLKSYTVRKGENRRDRFTTEEIHKLFPAEHDTALKIHQTQKWLTFHLIAADCGIRSGEIAALTWGVWKRSLHGLLILKTFSTDEMTMRDTTKSDEKGIALLSERTEQELLLWESMADRTEPEDLIFCDTDGGPIRAEVSNKHFKASCKRAGIELNGRTQYSLRHSFATDALSLIPHGTVRMLMHHRDDKSMKHYDHREIEQRLTEKLQDKKIQEARKFLARRWG